MAQSYFKTVILSCFFIFHALASYAQNHQTFQIARPVGIGAAGIGLHASNRIYRAYPGIPYQIHADAVGGRWPYTYSLSSAPAGMTIEPGPCSNIGPSGCTAGTINWPNPILGITNPITVTIRDADGRTLTGTWSINVNSTIGANGFCFLNADSGNDTTGNGSLNSPYRSIAKAHASCGTRSIIYFRGASLPYTIDPSLEDGTIPGDCDRRVVWPENNRGVIWLGYPGENPTIDFESAGDAQPCFQMQGENIWIEGLRIRNIGSIGFKLNIRSGGYGAVIRKIDAQNLLFGGNGKNSSFFLWSRCDDCPTWFDTVQNSSFHNVGTGACSLKLYGIRYGLFETSNYSRTLDREASLALKGTVAHYTVRANTCSSDVLTCFGGNMATSTAGLGIYNTGGEIYHNLVRSSGTASGEGGITIGVAKVDPIAQTWVYRNTFIGNVNVSNVATNDGPYYFNNNIIINSGGSGGSCPPRLNCYGITDPLGFARIIFNGSNNLQGSSSDGIIDINGNLQGNYRNLWINQRGYELSTTNNGGTNLTPLAPTNLRITL
ncbi:MAG: hypothetical protein AABY53_03055 [Bdellovibrionota bacterium]